MVTLRIETSSRWDALALTQKLPRYSWYLVEPDSLHWDVCVPLEEPLTRLPADLHRAIELWRSERNVEPTSIRADDRTFDLG
jgi:hypothetical protein